jgi:hypothetical protein
MHSAANIHVMTWTRSMSFQFCLMVLRAKPVLAYTNCKGGLNAFEACWGVPAAAVSAAVNWYVESPKVGKSPSRDLWIRFIALPQSQL